MTLTVTTEPMDSRQLSMTIEVADERIDQEMRKAAANSPGKCAFLVSAKGAFLSHTASVRWPRGNHQ